MQVSFAALTDPGSRVANEDSVVAAEIPGNGWLLGVADGVGGLERGAEASRTVIAAVQSGFSGRSGTESDGELLTAAVQQANAKVRGGRGDRRSMSGSTVVAVVIRPAGFTVASVGDSRAYLLRQDALMRLTEDHSFVAEQVRAGIISEAEAARSRHRNIITRSIGTSDHVAVDVVGPLEVRTGDVFLLCSDGLHGVVSDGEIGQAIGADRRVEEVAGDLVSLANARGGPDNISVVIARVQ